LRHSANFGRLPQDTWPRWRVENNTIESCSYTSLAWWRRLNNVQCSVYLWQ
jgi:hypothetical protein